MRISELRAVLQTYMAVSTPPTSDPTILHITDDHRNVTAGSLFVAVSGTRFDGHSFIAEALSRGAVAVISEHTLDVLGTSPYLIVPNGRLALALAAAAINGMPSRHLRMIGVTGTDGKTTTTTLIRSLLTAAGYTAGMVTTLGATIGDHHLETAVHTTTPGAPELQAYLAQIVAAQGTHAVIETTSHALAQQRVVGCSFDVAVITNITHEHLDYHGTFAQYRDTKAELFRSLRNDPLVKLDVPKVAVLNRADPAYELLRELAADQQLSYALSDEADVYATDIVYTPTGTHFVCHTPVGAFPLSLVLPGAHNVANALAASAVGVALQVPATAIQQGLAAVQQITARMTRVAQGQPFEVYVDYAHTPNALMQILTFARQLTQGRVILVFGLSGGPRDSSKRPLMGRIAGQMADQLVITSVDWYDEHVDAITHQIATGCAEVGRREGTDFWRVHDRRAGISTGIALAAPGDVVLIAGKGHERVITYGYVDQPWDEFAAVRDGIAQWLAQHDHTAER